MASVDSHNTSLLIGSSGRKWVLQTLKRGRDSLGYVRTAATQRELTNFLRVGHRNVYVKRISSLLLFNLQKTAKQQSLQYSEPSAFLHIYTSSCVTTILWAMLMLMLTAQIEAAFKVELKEGERSERTSSKEECVNMSSCVRPMRGVMTEVGGVMGVMAGDGPSDSRMSLSGLSSETSSVASVEGRRETLSGRKTNFPVL